MVTSPGTHSGADIILKRRYCICFFVRCTKWLWQRQCFGILNGPMGISENWGRLSSKPGPEYCSLGSVPRKKINICRHFKSIYVFSCLVSVMNAHCKLIINPEQQNKNDYKKFISLCVLQLSMIIFAVEAKSYLEANFFFKWIQDRVLPSKLIYFLPLSSSSDSMGPLWKAPLPDLFWISIAVCFRYWVTWYWQSTNISVQYSFFK